MIDLHTHILYESDQGPFDIDESIQIIKRAYTVGFNGLVLAPKFVLKTNFTKTRTENKYKLKKLESYLEKEGLKIKLFLANEIFCDLEMISKIGQDFFTSINKSRYFLIETHHRKMSLNYLKIFSEELIAQHYVPILTHPEQYDCFQENPERLSELKESGLLTQLNLLSFIGENGEMAEYTAKVLLENQAIDFLATEASCSSAYDYAEESIDQMEGFIGSDKLERILKINPAKVILNQKI